jgi:peptide-methionine (S)-S-oxide reductase
MDKAAVLDSLFCEAVSAIDAGDVARLERLLAEHTRLVRDRLDSPGAWLRDKVGGALKGFFRQPYLLWFVAEDPVRNGRLPGNIAQLAGMIIEAAKREGVDSLQEQLDYALRLVCWSWIARECGVQIELIDVLIDAGASVDGLTVYESRFGTHSDSAIYKMLALGVDPTTVSVRNQSHGTALHHAVWSGSLDAVKVLVQAGADLNRRDSIYDGTPLGWARYGEREQKEASRAKRYAEIAAYLHEQAGQE